MTVLSVPCFEVNSIKHYPCESVIAVGEVKANINSTDTLRNALVIQGCANLMDKFRGYGDNIELQSADKLITHKADNGRVLVIEYEVHGTILATGVKYNNRFCSIVKTENRKISHWRDYMDSLAAWNALTPHAR